MTAPAPGLRATDLVRIAARISFAGIDARSLDSARLQWVINARCRARRIADFAEYIAFLEQTPAEAEALVEELVVPETRFFRDAVVFDHLRPALAELAATTAGPLRLLSAPCSTGQEAYSLAATLVLAGVPPESFTIDAFDISSVALATARAGLYPLNSMRDVSPEQAAACGAADGKQFRVHAELRERVNFAQRNLVEPTALGETPVYHAVLCRNLFIYLHAEARATLASSLAQALLPGGRLVLGSADHVPELAKLFAPLRPAASFAFVRQGSPAAARAPQPVLRSTPRDRRGAAQRAAVRPNETRPPSVRGKHSVPTAEDLHTRAMEAQRAGNLRLAERRCRQALYLEPGHMPSLELLDTLWNSTASIRLRRALAERIERARRSSLLGNGSDDAQWSRP